MTSYNDAFGALAGVYLEDSWVLAVWPAENMLAFDVEAVLTPDHPEYRGPRSGEQHDYRRAKLTLLGQVSVALSGHPPATDASGEEDMGHIDWWTVSDEGVSRLGGDWGQAEVVRASVGFQLL